MSAEPPPINFYLVEKFNNTLLEYDYSRANQQTELKGSRNKSYYSTPYYDSKDNLVGYGITNEEGRLDYVVNKSDYKNFQDNLDTYRDAADLINQNGEPTENEIALISALQEGSFSETMSAIGGMWKEDGAIFNALITSVGASGVGFLKSTPKSLGSARSSARSWLLEVGNLERSALIENIESAGFKRMTPLTSPVTVYQRVAYVLE